MLWVNIWVNISQISPTGGQQLHYLQVCVCVCVSGRLLVHCVMGRSRSATLVLAYLMIHERLSVVDAITHVRHRRCVLPNRGFIKQLRELDITLQQERHSQRIRATDTQQKSVRDRGRERGRRMIERGEGEREMA